LRSWGTGRVTLGDALRAAAPAAPAAAERGPLTGFGSGRCGAIRWGQGLSFHCFRVSGF